MDLRYPIGEFNHEGTITLESINEWIKEIENAPGELKEAVKGLEDEQLDTPYRPDGWTVRQVVHHLADSHMNAYVRFKLALTENNPTIKPYQESEWAELPDSRMSVEVSLTLLEALHARWVTLLRSLNSTQLEQTFQHPDSGIVQVGYNIGLYAWHGRHHIAHITILRKRLGW
ncbi:YfiT family bacillithiol transferase [Bacillus sp. CECT 9360]|uniref:YfiT family bacillithiol transferase n=1 Tax=Bacillus sp. CECT 9360 TaxID=2845821 RepID=UPI001E4307C5|nr:bacillithiol transferase BstA [Bacillus sp. CECT 9360]CAH0343980.1 Putative metal-dependent hydrolase YfiT [Bacillus sp. CECT 9360]